MFIFQRKERKQVIINKLISSNTLKWSFSDLSAAQVLYH